MRMLLFAVPGICLTLGGCAIGGATPDDKAESETLITSTSETADPDTYHVPVGFFGYAWDTHLVEIPNLKLLPGGAALVAGYQGKVMDVRLQNCIPGMTEAGPCRIYQQVAGAGSYVMASYFREYEPVNPYPGAQLSAAIYYFCARTNGDFVSEHVTERLRLCGGDVIFQSDAPKVWKEGDPDTNYDRVVRALTERYGRPDDFQYSGYVTVDDEYGLDAKPREQNYDPIFWCRISQRALDPSCQATITLDFDDDTASGRVLFATDDMYRFAEALHELSEEKIPLYERLHGYGPDRFKSQRRVCTGTHLCGGGTRQLTDREIAFLRPDTGQ